MSIFKFGRGIVDDRNVFVRITTVPVQGGNRRISVRWTPEMAQDVQAFHGIDAEAELMALLSEEMMTEFHREVIGDIREFAKKISFKFGR